MYLPYNQFSKMEKKNIKSELAQIPQIVKDKVNNSVKHFNARMAMIRLYIYIDSKADTDNIAAISQFDFEQINTNYKLSLDRLIELGIISRFGAYNPKQGHPKKYKINF